MSTSFVIGSDPTTLQVDHVGATLVLRGECDISSADALTRELRRQERGHDAFDIDLSRVTFADTYGLELLADSVRRCRRRGDPEPRIAAISPYVRRVFTLLGVALDPFDLRAWDELEPPVQRRTLAAETLAERPVASPPRLSSGDRRPPAWRPK